MGVADKVVLMTGANSGLGKCIIKNCLERGSKVCMTDIHVKEGNEILNSFQNQFGDEKVMFTRLDVTKEEDFHNAFDECKTRLGTVDILINSAMYIVSDYMKSTQINYLAAVRGTETAFKKIGKQYGGKGGHVVNIGSITGMSVAPYMPFYAAAKAAVIHYSRCVGDPFHFQHTGVSVQTICQTAIKTEVMDQLKATTYSPATIKFLAEVVDVFPKADPEDVVKAVFQLIEEKRPGAALVVDTGKEPFYVEPILEKFMKAFLNSKA